MKVRITNTQRSRKDIPYRLGKPPTKGQKDTREVKHLVLPPNDPQSPGFASKPHQVIVDSDTLKALNEVGAFRGMVEKGWIEVTNADLVTAGA